MDFLYLWLFTIDVYLQTIEISQVTLKIKPKMFDSNTLWDITFNQVKSILPELLIDPVSDVEFEKWEQVFIQFLYREPNYTRICHYGGII